MWNRTAVSLALPRGGGCRKCQCASVAHHGPHCGPPLHADALPGREIWVKYNVSNLYNVDTREQTFEARLNLEFTWEEPALNGHDPDKPIDWEAVWRPRRIELLNGHDVKYEPTYELCTWETRPSGNAVVTCYATAYGVSATRLLPRRIILHRCWFSEV